MSIHFRSLKYKTSYNIGFEVDKGSLANINDMHIGDTFTLSHEVTQEQEENIRLIENREGLYVSTPNKKDELPTVYIPFRTYPADSVLPVQPEKPPRFTSPCPYPPCTFVASALREYQLAGMLTRHKRTAHENAFIDELAARNQEAQATVEAEPLINVCVAAFYYRNRSMSTTYPEPKTVLVPERWHVTSVFVTCQSNGAFVAYKGAWGVG